jgi:hypothetical protein
MRIPRAACVAFIITTSLASCVRAPDKPDPDGAGQGVVLVSYPEVHTRERLLYDRAEQAKWLRAQLEKTYSDSLVFGNVGIRDRRSY